MKFRTPQLIFLTTLAAFTLPALLSALPAASERGDGARPRGVS